jgi:hypothetical protein
VRLLQVQGSEKDNTLTVLWVGCRDATVAVSAEARSVRVAVSQNNPCDAALTWGRRVELAEPIGNRVIHDRTPASNCD